MTTILVLLSVFGRQILHEHDFRADNKFLFFYKKPVVIGLNISEKTQLIFSDHFFGIS